MSVFGLVRERAGDALNISREKLAVLRQAFAQNIQGITCPFLRVWGGLFEV